MIRVMRIRGIRVNRVRVIRVIRIITVPVIEDGNSSKGASVLEQTRDAQLQK